MQKNLSKHQKEAFYKSGDSRIRISFGNRLDEIYKHLNGRNLNDFVLQAVFNEIERESRITNIKEDINQAMDNWADEIKRG